MLQHKAHIQEPVVSKALHLLRSIEQAPACEHLAAVNLINDCNSLVRDPQDTSSKSEQLLEAVKTEYAARLAVCELSPVRSGVPRACSLLIPTPNACRKTGFISYWRQQEQESEQLCYPSMTPAKFQGCLDALHKDKSAWNSYSNSRQNAVVICQATRESTERDTTIKIHKNLTEVVGHLTSVIAEHVDKSSEYVENLRRAQEQSREDTERNHEAATKGYEDINHAIDRTSNKMESLSQELTSRLSQPGELAHQVIGQLGALSQHLAEVDERLARQEAQQGQLAESAFATMQQQEHTVGRLTTDLNDLRGNIVGSIEDMGTVRQGYQELNSTTENLKGALETGAHIIRFLNTLSIVFFNRNAWIVVLAPIVVFGTWQFNRKIAGFLIALFGTVALLWLIGLQDYLYTLKTVTADVLDAIVSKFSNPRILWACFTFTILSTVPWLVKCTYLQRFRGTMGSFILPKIEIPAAPVVLSLDAEELEFGVLRSIQTPNLRTKPYYYRNNTGKRVVFKADVPNISQHRTGSPHHFEQDRAVRAASVC
ncbi:hypothetical protein K491DRAFT_776820 [Lophiostoma macrostomum CBS 122681]|uniref:Uncharacterized protein n=1 Tax=Lophiostoma macrostomum CBS 122681 TaxID=1314788 RepID=A0A6A6TH14_9PLEO|nr:hypothetical protein K491DRAFT_776820 [Lophiostoma macrostomum CBS 122681]